LTDIEQYPSNEVIKVGMKVLVELKKDKGTGNLTEGIVQKKLSIIAHDPNGIVVKIEHGQQGRVHKIIDPDFIGKDSKKTLITLRHGEYLSNRIKIVDLLSNADDFIWLLVGYFKHNHFDILREVLDNNKKLIPEINSSSINDLIENETITGGMIPKINNCLDVASNGVKGVVIIDGRKNHSILFELLSDKGSGTLIRQ